MTKQNFSIWANLAYDGPAALVVFLVALPLCLGIALASGAPLFSGVIAGIVGGIVVGALSRSPLSVSGPAAGLTVIVYAAIQELQSFQAFLLAVCLAGGLQILLSICRAGVIGDFIPSTVIKGMLTAIGLILIMKQIPHAVGFTASFEEDHSYLLEHRSEISAFWEGLTGLILPGAMLISGLSLAFLMWWDKKQPTLKSALRYIPGPLVVVLFGVAMNALFKTHYPEWAIDATHLVAVPVTASLGDLWSGLHAPDISLIWHKNIWIIAVTLAIVASIETLLSIEAIDKLDSFKRVTPTNRELFAQGAGNIVSGLLGGLPVTSVIVRSSANVASGGRTKMAAILHGVVLLLAVISVPVLLNQIPLSALAAILIAVGYKLAKPKIFKETFKQGWASFIPFAVTVGAILLTDLLIGIGLGVAVGIVFILIHNFRSSLLCVEDADHYLVRLKKDFFFLHKYELKKTLNAIPDGAKLLLDVSRTGFIDRDNIEIINDFITNAHYRGISITLKTNAESDFASQLKEPIQ